MGRRRSIKIYSTEEELYANTPQAKKNHRAFQVTAHDGTRYYCWAVGYKDALYAVVRGLDAFKVKQLKGDQKDTDRKIKRIAAKLSNLSEEERQRLIDALQKK